jgi:Ca-activated chloride channel family protein
VVLPVDGVTRRRGMLLRFIINVAAMLPAMLLAAVIVILAKPMQNMPPEVERQLTNIQIVLDNSGSMARPYGPQPGGGRKLTRFDAAMDGIDKFLEMRKDDAFGLTVFATCYLHWVPLTRDTSAISLARPFIVPYDYAIRGWQAGFNRGDLGGTHTGSALLGAIDLLRQRPEGDRMIVLVTDGEADYADLSPSRVSLVLRELKKSNISCYAIYINERPAPRNLKKICRETGGELIEVNDERSLESVFAHIDSMRKVKIKQTESGARERTAPVIIVALGLLCMNLLMLTGLRYTPW